jgi:hypothetical protein
MGEHLESIQTSEDSRGGEESLCVHCNLGTRKLAEWELAQRNGQIAAALLVRYEWS